MAGGVTGTKFESQLAATALRLLRDTRMKCHWISIRPLREYLKELVASYYPRQEPLGSFALRCLENGVYMLVVE